jgi:arabinose-5-phosphate isomerase
MVSKDASMQQALLEMSQKGLGMTSVVDDEGKLLGLFTDGDLRRVFDLRVDLHNTAIGEMIHSNCVTAPAHMLAAEALKLIEDKKINGLVITDEDSRPVGALNMQTLLQAGVL